MRILEIMIYKLTGRRASRNILFETLCRWYDEYLPKAERTNYDNVICIVPGSQVCGLVRSKRRLQLRP